MLFPSNNEVCNWLVNMHCVLYGTEEQIDSDCMSHRKNWESHTFISPKLWFMIIHIAQCSSCVWILLTLSKFKNQWNILFFSNENLEDANIVRAFEYFSHQGHPTIIFELLGASLADFLNLQPVQPLQFIRGVMHQVRVTMVLLPMTGSLVLV